MHTALDLLTIVRITAINLNKLEHGQRLQAQRAVCSCAKLVDDAMAVAEHLHSRKAVELQASVSDALRAQDAILTDRGWCFLILVNLLSNALKNTAEGAIRIDLRLAPDDASSLRLQVSDTGLGVPPELEPHLFGAYHQASRWRFGTGLGLFHVHELAMALGGAAGYARNSPQGACFWVDVPFVPASHQLGDAGAGSLGVSGSARAGPSPRDRIAASSGGGGGGGVAPLATRTGEQAPGGEATARAPTREPCRARRRRPSTTTRAPAAPPLGSFRPSVWWSWRTRSSSRRRR